MRTWMLGAALIAGAAAMNAMPAEAAEFHIHIGGPVAYVPPSPGPGYFWVDGYWDQGYWVPGRWEYRGVPVMSYYGGYYGAPRWEHERFDRWEDRRYDRHDYDRDHDHGYDRGYDHGYGRGYDHRGRW